MLEVEGVWEGEPRGQHTVGGGVLITLMSFPYLHKDCEEQEKSIVMMALHLTHR